MARTRSQREQDRLEGQYLRQKQKLEDEARRSVVTVCEKHDWRVSLADGRPAPPASNCPGCQLDAMGSRAGEKFETRKVSLAEQTGETLEMQLAYERHLERQGGVRAGSFEEQRALDQIETAREEEQQKEEARKKGLLHGGQFVTQRIRGGELIAIYRVARGRFVEVAS